MDSRRIGRHRSARDRRQSVLRFLNRRRQVRSVTRNIRESRPLRRSFPEDQFVAQDVRVADGLIPASCERTVVEESRSRGEDETGPSGESQNLNMSPVVCLENIDHLIPKCPPVEVVRPLRYVPMERLGREVQLHPDDVFPPVPWDDIPPGTNGSLELLSPSPMPPRSPDEVDEIDEVDDVIRDPDWIPPPCRRSRSQVSDEDDSPIDSPVALEPRISPRRAPPSLEENVSEVREPSIEPVPLVSGMEAMEEEIVEGGEEEAEEPSIEPVPLVSGMETMEAENENVEGGEEESGNPHAREPADDPVIIIISDTEDEIQPPPIVQPPPRQRRRRRRRVDAPRMISSAVPLGYLTVLNGRIYVQVPRDPPFNLIPDGQFHYLRWP